MFNSGSDLLTWGTFNSYLELTFAINAMFATWPKLGEVLVDWLVRRARLEERKADSLKNEFVKVGGRILSLKKRCDRNIPRWRLAAAAMAFTVLFSLLLVPDSALIDSCWHLLIAAAVFPPIGASVHLGVWAFVCAIMNGIDMKEPPDSVNPEEVEAILRKITGEDAPR